MIKGIIRKNFIYSNQNEPKVDCSVMYCDDHSVIQRDSEEDSNLSDLEIDSASEYSGIENIKDIEISSKESTINSRVSLGTQEDFSRIFG